MSELKPCPFCGRQPRFNGKRVYCVSLSCLASHLHSVSPEIWNSPRPIEDALRAEVARLEGVVEKRGYQVSGLMEENAALRARLELEGKP